MDYLSKENVNYLATPMRANKGGLAGIKSGNRGTGKKKALADVGNTLKVNCAKMIKQSAVAFKNSTNSPRTAIKNKIHRSEKKVVHSEIKNPTFHSRIFLDAEEDFDINCHCNKDFKGRVYFEDDLLPESMRLMDEEADSLAKCDYRRSPTVKDLSDSCLISNAQLPEDLEFEINMVLDINEPYFEEPAMNYSALTMADVFD